MFKFKCDGNFDNNSNVYRQYYDKDVDANGTTISIKVYNITTKDTNINITTSSLANKDYYLYDVYKNDNGETVNDIVEKSRGKNEIDFPEIKDAKSCLTTNDGLVIFNYDVNNYKFAIVYDLTVSSTEYDFDTIEFIPLNMIDTLRYFKYTSPRVHQLEFDSNGKIQPKIIFKSIEGNTTKIHFFVDIDLKDIEYDEYGYYVCDNKLPTIEDMAYIPRKSKTLVATEKIFNDMAFIDDSYFCNIDKEFSLNDIVSDNVKGKNVFLCY